MKTKHTPGPWFRDDTSGIKCDVRAENGRKIALTWGLGCGNNYKKEYKYECDANARLIAAAPDLLAEIESEYEELSDITNEWPGRNTAQGQAKLCRLRDLISKATGRDAEEVQDDYCSRAIAKKGIQP